MSPTPPSNPVNLEGTWVEVGGVVSGTGGVLGTVVFGGYVFAETYESLTIPSRPSPNNCYIDTHGQLTINGNTMTGSVTETAGCAGVRVGEVTRSLMMQRR
jgi:hypothetical protein